MDYELIEIEGGLDASTITVKVNGKTLENIKRVEFISEVGKVNKVILEYSIIEKVNIKANAQVKTRRAKK